MVRTQANIVFKWKLNTFLITDKWKYVPLQSHILRRIGTAPKDSLPIGTVDQCHYSYVHHVHIIQWTRVAVADWYRTRCAVRTHTKMWKETMECLDCQFMVLGLTDNAIVDGRADNEKKIHTHTRWLVARLISLFLIKLCWPNGSRRVDERIQFIWASAASALKCTSRPYAVLLAFYRPTDVNAFPLFIHNI